MKKTILSMLIAASAIGLANTTQAQVSGGVAAGSAPGVAVVERTVTVTATVAAIDMTTRQVTLRGPEGREFVVVAGDEVRNLAQLRIGDSVSIVYIDALALELKKGGTGALASRTEATGAARGAAGQRPVAATAREVTIVADVVALDPVKQIVSLRGPKGNVVDLPVRDAEQFKRVAIGDQVQATYIEAVAIGVTPMVLATTAAAPLRKPFSFFVFLWGSAVDSDLTVKDPRTGASITVSTDADFGKILDNLDSAFMFYGDWTSGRWSVFGDWTYTRLSPSANLVRAPQPTSVGAALKTQIGDLAVAYQVAGQDDTRVELYGGARYYNLNNSFTLNSASGSVMADSKDNWVDAFGGVRVRGRLGPRWVGVAQADYGAGGSDHSWQAWAYVGYEFDWGSIGAGWRYLNFSRSHNGNTTDMAFNGPVLGVVAKF